MKSSIMEKMFIFFIPIIIISIGFFEKSLTNVWYYFLIAYFLDAGHVYSTFVETHFDLKHPRLKTIYIYTFIAYLLNLAILYSSRDLFYSYIFYFTVFHNMRQGLGVILLNDNKLNKALIKVLYYIGTMIPFLLFHVRDLKAVVSKDIFHPFNLHNYLGMINLNTAYMCYFVIIAIIGLFFIIKKELKIIIPFFWFCLIYCYSWMFSNNVILSYVMLVSTHAIPYYWLFYKRVSLTHSIKTIRDNAIYLVLIFFLIGGLMDYIHDDAGYQLNLFLEALFFTPLITHFLLDGILWKMKDDRFKIFINNYNKSI